MDKKKLIYSILKELDNGNKPTAKDFGVTVNEFGAVLELMMAERYITGAIIQKGGKGGNVVFATIAHATILKPGLDYLDENSTWAKTYKGIKEFLSLIK